jgi:hypothetical protein
VTMRWLRLSPLVLRSPRRGRLEGCSRRLGQIALGLMRPIVAALNSPSSDGRSSERPLERGDAKPHSPKLQSAPGRARSTVPFGKLRAGFRDASPSAPLLRTRSWWQRAAALGVGLALLACLTGPALAVQPDEVMKDPALETRARALSAELRCLVCQN